jgi:hypothetical protein
LDVPVAVIAEAANVSLEGNLNVVGIFNTIWASEFPTNVSVCLVVQLRGGADDSGDHNIMVTLDERDDVQIAMSFTFPPDVPDPVANHVVRIVPFTLLEPKRHVFHVIVDGVERAAIPITGRLIEPPTTQE